MRPAAEQDARYELAAEHLVSLERAAAEKEAAVASAVAVARVELEHQVTASKEQLDRTETGAARSGDRRLRQRTRRRLPPAAEQDARYELAAAEHLAS